MALIKCPECGTAVSDRAPTCPNCGCPLKGDDAGIARLIFIRTHFATLFQSMVVSNDNGQQLFTINLVDDLPKNGRRQAEIAIVGPTEITISILERKSGLLSTGYRLMYSDSCIVEPNHTYLISDSSGKFTICEES